MCHPSKSRAVFQETFLPKGPLFGAVVCGSQGELSCWCPSGGSMHGESGTPDVRLPRAAFLRGPSSRWPFAFNEAPSMVSTSVSHSEPRLGRGLFQPCVLQP